MYLNHVFRPYVPPFFVAYSTGVAFVTGAYVEYRAELIGAELRSRAERMSRGKNPAYPIILLHSWGCCCTCAEKGVDSVLTLTEGTCKSQEGGTAQRFARSSAPATAAQALAQTSARLRHARRRSIHHETRQPARPSGRLRPPSCLVFLPRGARLEGVHGHFRISAALPACVSASRAR